MPRRRTTSNFPDPDPPHDPLEGQPEGYPKLAARMALRPETTMLRQFSTLSIRNLLYMQAELTTLEKDLDRCTKQDDMKEKSNEAKYATRWAYLAASHRESHPEQLQAVVKIRRLLPDYHKALLRHAKLNRMLGPNEYDMSDLQHFLGSTKMGPSCIDGDDAYTWGSAPLPKTYKPDLIALKPRINEDTFSRWVAERALLLIRIFGRCLKPNVQLGTVVIYDSVIMRVTFWITSIIASVIPIASIVVLLHLKSQAAKLGAIAAFNVLITLCLSFFTEAKRSDCFAVTAAFTAVQIVFLGVEKGSRS